MNPSTALATVVVDELVRAGVRDAVLCPGSRSAPFAFALARADAAGRVRLHVRTDERSAAFLALGLAKHGRPVPVVTTSGTAVANLHPAVLEASHSGVPLIVVSADRPAELRGTGANQTTDQVGIFGGAVRLFRDLGVPDDRPGQVATWRGVVSRSVVAALGGLHLATPGPVHLNVPLREPLVPDGDGDWVEPLDGRADEQPWTRVVPSPAAEPEPLSAEPRTLVLVGDLPPGPWGDLAADVAEAAGWPLIAEPSSGGAWSRALPHGVLLLGDDDWLARHRPERVLAIGHLTLARPVSRLLADPRIALDVVSYGEDWADPPARARSVRPLTSLAVPRSSVGRWVSEWGAAADAVTAAIGELPWPTGTAVARELVAALPEGAVLFAGSSNPIRDLHVAAVPGALTVVANRGLAGIDGNLSTASGIALAGDGPTYALVGDLTFLHDSNGLVRGADEPAPDLTVVVVNDDGGGIFGLLEPGAPQHADVFERVFGTPHGVDLGRLCTATGTPHEVVATRAELRAAVAQEPKGLRVLEIRVDRSGHAAANAALRAAAAEALSSR